MPGPRKAPKSPEITLRAQSVGEDLGDEPSQAQEPIRRGPCHYDGDVHANCGMDGHKWTEAFLQIWPDGSNDFGLMLGWFCNAIMAGYDEAQRRADSTIAEWMTARGYATGHGDTLEDMLAELEGEAQSRALQSVRDGQTSLPQQPPSLEGWPDDAAVERAARQMCCGLGNCQMEENGRICDAKEIAGDEARQVLLAAAPALKGEGG